MFVDISNDLITELYELLLEDGVDVITSYPNDDFEGKVVVYEELSNIDRLTTKTMSGSKYNDISIQLSIFTTGDIKETKAKLIRNKIDEYLGGTYNMSRVDAREIPNYGNLNVYRYILRYTFSINEKLEIYRG